MAAKLSDDTQVAMPLRNILSIIAGVAVATWAYFGIIERINNLETEQTLMTSDLEKNTEFRIKWPRGEMGSLPADSEQFMLIEHLASELEKLTTEIETGKAPFDQQQKLTLEFYETRIKKLETQIDELKDKIMNNHYEAVKNGTH
tara:strand:+ start:318 stop:752 length:435 start_codon:yes stop_codon:yes gene_type:complete